MSVTVSKKEVLLFIQNKIGKELDAKEAKDLKIQKEYNAAVEDKDEEELKIEEIAEDSDLYAQFASMCQDEKVNDNKESEDKKKEKENKVKDKNQAKA